MIRHIFKTYFRDLIKNKTYTLINLFGMGIALSCAFLIFLFVLNEFSTDKFHKNKDNIYRLYVTFQWGVNQEGNLASSSFLMREALLNDFPEINKVTRIYDYSLWGDKQMVQQGNDFIHEADFKLVDNDFFEIFTYKITQGAKINPLESEQSLLISESAVEKYFPNENPIGKNLFVKNNLTEELFIIVGVFEGIPQNSTFQADFIGNIDIIDDVYIERGWNPTNMQTYLLTDAGTPKEDLQSKIDKLPEKYHSELPYSYTLQNLDDVYFKSDFFNWYFQERGDLKNVYMFSIIAFLIIMVASINYILLSTARGIGRNIEIGIRKVVGASRKTIFRQITAESVFFLFLIFPLALMISELLLPIVNRLLSRNLEIEYFNNWPYLLGLILITIIVGFISGSYISVFLSRFQPEDILKRKFTSKFGKSILRQSLMIIQLIVFITLFIFAGIIFKQLSFIEKHDLGYSPENVLVVQPPHDHDLTSCAPFVNSVKTLPEIEAISEVSSGIFTSNQAAQNYSNPDNSEDELAVRLFWVDHAYKNTFELEILKGRWFDENNSSDYSKAIVNETTVKKLNLSGELPMYLARNEERIEIIGVVKDFNVQSLKSNMIPVAMILKSDNHMLCQIAVRYNEKTQIQNLIKKLDTNWTEYGAKGMFEYYFFEDKLKDLYKDDKNFGDTIKFFAVLTILIALLGLFGFSLFSSRQRNKEISIRKAFGATPKDIIKLLSKDFVLLTTIANVIAWPVAFKLSSNWLSGYAFQIPIPIILFFGALIISTFTVFTIMFINGIKAANQNPGVTLRYE